MDAFEKRKNREHSKKFNKQVAEIKKQTSSKKYEGSDFENEDLLGKRGGNIR